MKADLYLTPIPLDNAELDGKVVVVIDVLRSSTSICAALAAGAKGVIPTSGPGEAGEMWTRLGGDMAVLAGERGGVKIENFNFGNSPTEFTEDAIGGKFIVMTTTNGTPIFSRAASARAVYSCGLVNVSSISEAVAGMNLDLVLICSGREGSFSVEDTLCGGMILHVLSTTHGCKLELNDAASLAGLLYHNSATSIRPTIMKGEHGQYLSSLGFGRDVEIATDIDSIPVTPVLRDGRLVLHEE
jgi:2-phosphosulfolactate phosphatase